MKKKTFLIPICIILQYLSIGQVSPITDDQVADVSITEKQAHQRFRDAAGKTSMDSFTVASDNIDVNHYRCEWQVDPNVRFIKGKVTALFTVRSPSDRIIFDLSSLLTVDSVLYQGVAISFQRVLKDG
jgi:hypothetical protein